MTPAVLGLVLGASVAHALWNIAAKSVSGKGYAFVLAYHGLSAILLAPIAVWLIASGAHDLNVALVGAAVLSAVFHIAYSVSLQSGYDHAPLGVVYPTARGVGPVITIIIAVLFLGERPSGPETIGAFVVLAGIAVVTVRPRAVGGVAASGGGQLGGGVRLGGGQLGGGVRLGGGHATGSHGFGRGLAWGGLIGVFIASYTLWDDFSVNHISDSPLLYFAVSEACVGLIMALGIVTIPGGAARRADFRSILAGHKRALVTVAILSPLAYLLVLFAMQQAPVSLVAPVRETSIIVGTLLAWWFFGEKNIGMKLLGAVVVVAGIGLIAPG
ncbi:EamA family transporter [Brevibacterium marinum]|uniref:Drug/metabolite transporter (DMT)-like permease n=1 Tax=Brevibacterium marinum TaxID=418643 RepID=A0A846SBM1_9MICO|nr:EamA family transporter [Brevibacterium marinum]NJC58662.1 drug/metabolite transporter (DMT)-like permease [Brevibacterium marinum]